MSEDEVRAAHRLFDTWCRANAERADVISADFRSAAAAIRSLELPLKAPDAVHIMIALRLGATLATFDVTMAREADRLGVTIAT